MDVVVIDVDGTLVDSVYEHAVSWVAAFHAAGVAVTAAAVHRHVGMGGDHLVEAVAGADVERRLGDRIRGGHAERFAGLRPQVAPLPGAADLLRAAGGGGRGVALSSSAKPDEMEHYLELLDARQLVDAWTTSGDVESTKPDPDLVTLAAEQAGGRPLVMIGDAPWDCEAAARVGVPTLALLTGGFCRHELEQAGALAVFQDAAELAGELPERLGAVRGAARG
jgi:HAD superfamily hydrolase (TIGR01509 family)